MRPRIKITSDTSNWCTQPGTVSWAIYDSVNSNSLQTGSFTTPASSAASICYVMIRQELLLKIQSYIAVNTIMEADGTLPTTLGASTSGAGGPADWADITNKPFTFPPDAHAHGWAAITGKPTLFDTDWSLVQGKPLTFTPTNHNHLWADITNPPASGSIPAGAIVFIASGSCGVTLGSGWTEYAAGGGRALVMTLAANTDVGTTGGSDTITQTLNHTHPVTDPGHAHTTQRYPTATGTSTGFTIDTSMSGTLANNTLPTAAATTGVTTTNPAGGVASIDNRQAFIKLICCVKQ